MKLSLFLVCFLLALGFSCAQKQWCVVKVSAPNEKLQSFLDSACSQLDCKDVNPGGACYQPNTLQNHASYVLNLDYRAHGTCNLDLGTIAVKDPSYGTCRYS